VNHPDVPVVHAIMTKTGVAQRSWTLPRGRRVSRWFLFALGALVVWLITARLALPYILRNAINHRLEAIPDYTGRVEDVGVSLWRGAYTLHGLVVLKSNGAIKEPFIKVEEIDFSVAWRDLIHGKIVSDIVLQKPSLTFVAAKAKADSQMTADHRWQDVIGDIFPIDITFLKISDGQLRYINQEATPKVDVRIAHLQVVASGLRNRGQPGEGEFPAQITAEGETIGGGRLRLSTQLEPLALQPHFLLKLEVESLSLPAVNDFLQAYAGIDVRAGIFNGYIEAVARGGKFSGYFKPFFEEVDFSTPPGETRPLGQQIWETLVRGFAWVFKNHARDQVATRIPFSGKFENLDVSTWASFKNMVKHAFIEPLLKKLDSRDQPNTEAEPKTDQVSSTPSGG
jgi:hypothetical protein